ncbi:hypothetical protein DSM106972_094640 [Dulcicalothrix desertica PCC 7102]|uniref:Uncharacterized protein n=1 Tax=Dulcicalothrix desertica PCC 7102 TaxID=232991 RepID=A0A3S1AKA1_9CYAN|nr:hypothetical protein [Dulcicalothrix desertica]RUS93993.1 hypothetical protein DSM106972_094640 [Dulcicalothrix desertica PCC 7102]TWH62674.1 hypothetical protein CAL7102_00181 [Dulcicalothrix desertica PCC 7102]
MKTKIITASLTAIALLTSFASVISPASAEVYLPKTQVATNSFDYPSGYFKDVTWGVQLTYNGGEYNFKRIHLETQQSIDISNGRKSGNKNRQVYTWKQDGYSYRVSYRPQQPNIIRLEIYHPSGQAILNRLLYKG